MEVHKNNFDAVMDTEEALIGAILIDPSYIREVKKIVKPNHFFDERNKDIFTAMIECEHPDMVETAYKMNELGTYQKYPTLSWFYHCVAMCPTSMDTMHYAKYVRIYAAQRWIKAYNDSGKPEKAKEIMDKVFKPEIKGVRLDD